MKSMNVISRCQAIYRSAVLESELSPVHHSFILAICRAPGRSQDELARDLCLTKSTVTRALSFLEDGGYVLRKTNPDDKRETLVFPSEKMLSVHSEIRRIANEWNSGLTRDIGEEELAVFKSVLAKMEKNAKSLVNMEAEK